MCKQAIDENFCDCQTGSLRLVNEDAAQNVRVEVYESKFTREENNDKATIDFEDESNVLAFVLGIIVTFLVIGLALLITFLVIRTKRNNKKTEIYTK